MRQANRGHATHLGVFVVHERLVARVIPQLQPAQSRQMLQSQSLGDAPAAGTGSREGSPLQVLDST